MIFGRPFSIVVLILAICSCKKDKLTGEKEILIGEWEWVYTEKIVDYCDPDFLYYDTLDQLTEQTKYEIRFFANGKVQFYHENNLLETRRLVFVSFGCSSCCSDPDYSSFEIALDNNPDNRFDGCVTDDSLRGGDFPYPDNEVLISGQCFLTTNYFVRK